ncbi:MAG TPA: class I SAM-dependent methyltransferase [Beijerinckiaceae bacterium]|nr:class I SAM-dependent methyltransferase [Beijerinckiaceae bacterium]
MASLSNFSSFKDTNLSKENFDKIYVQPDPREYYRVLYGLDYVIPELAKPIFRNIVNALQEQEQRPIKVLDVGSSYGINAALLRFPIDLDRLGARYRDLSLSDIDREELVWHDRHYFLSWPAADVEVIGLDVSESAIRYAKEVGLISDGIVANLEERMLTDQEAEMLSDVDLIISTGCVGYIGERTFSKLLAAMDRTPWVASFVLRMFDYGELEGVFSSHELSTEKLKGVTFVQRRFNSYDEYTSVVSKLLETGVRVDGKESEGLLHAEFYLSRPRDASVELPLEQIAQVTSGANRRYGRRFRMTPAQTLRFGV